MNRVMQRAARFAAAALAAGGRTRRGCVQPCRRRRGVHGIRPLFQALIAEFSKPGATFDLQQQVIEGEVGSQRFSKKMSGQSGVSRVAAGEGHGTCHPSGGLNRDD
jgi:hypothetical protein